MFTENENDAPPQAVNPPTAAERSEGSGTPAPPSVGARPAARSSVSAYPGARDASLEVAAPKPAGRILAVASPKGGSGKTTIALNLALSMARQGRSVVLVDADVNGDVLSAIDARSRAEAGVFDVLFGMAEVKDALLDTILPKFRILPAVGRDVPPAEAFQIDNTENWGRVLREVASTADVVVVDTPAGMYGTTSQILPAASHVIGVLQAEVVASRSFERFQRALSQMSDATRPEVLGVVMNMLQMRHPASVNVLQGACSDLPGAWLFETSIPRHQAFLDATAQGVPLRHMDEQAPPAVAFLFDNLAAEVAERLSLPPVERRPRRLLL